MVSSRNKTLTLSDVEKFEYSQNLRVLDRVTLDTNIIINQDCREALSYIPHESANLIIVDPPYNLDKVYGSEKFSRRSSDEYKDFIRSWICILINILTPTGSLYICGEWSCISDIQYVLAPHLWLQNRITWEREKGRGAKHNWKNNSEDILFYTRHHNKYTFNVNAVKIKRPVIAPYKQDGQAKDWQDSEDGKYRLTYPSNIWTDLTVPYWSMPENTHHPTQKPEKLIARIILASSNPGDVVLDPFLGSGTTAVVAKKLGRKYIGIESDINWCQVANKRLALADTDKSIQGYKDGVFLHRNMKG